MAEAETLVRESFTHLSDDLDLAGLAPLQTLEKIDGTPYLGVLSRDITVGVGELTTGIKYVAVCLYRDEAGMFMPISANGARQLGAALIAAADELDGGKGVQ